MLNRKFILKKRAALMLMVVSLLAALPVPAATRNNNNSYWQVLAPQGGGFQVQFPGQPLKKVGATYIQYSYIQSTGYGNFFYGVTHEDYTVAPADIDSAARKQCTDFAKGFTGEVVKWMTITKNGYRGMAARVENKNSTAIVAAWVINRRAYTIAFVTPKSQTLPPEASRFIDSLAFVRY